MKLSEKIRRARNAVGLNQEELAEKLGVSYMTIRRWETGKSSPKYEDLEKISEIFDIPLSRFLEESTETSVENTPYKKLNQKMFSFECNGQRVEIPADKEFEGLFLEIVRGMRSHQSTVTVNNNAEAHDNAQAVALGDGIKV